MSSRAVRQAVRGWMAGLTTPFYDTINKEANPKDSIWVTVEFNSFGMTKETFCEQWVEEGDIALTFFGKPGIGDDAILAQAELDAAAFYGSVDPLGRVTIVNKSAPDDFAFTENGPRFGVTFRFGYEFRTT